MNLNLLYLQVHMYAGVVWPVKVCYVCVLIRCVDSNYAVTVNGKLVERRQPV